MFTTIQEKGRGVERVCGGRIRTRKIYISFSNEIQIIIAKTSDKDRRHFVIKYQGMDHLLCNPEQSQALFNIHYGISFLILLLNALLSTSIAPFYECT